MEYPKEVFNINESITRANMKAYDDEQARLYKRILEVYPNYYKFNLRERMNIRRMFEKEA